MDYAIPVAADLPDLETRSLAFPSTRNDLGIKGVGESAIIAPPAAIANAVEDALQARGADILEIPVTPSRVWRALQKGRAGARDAVSSSSARERPASVLRPRR